MLIGGFQKMTMLDFPGKVACTVFTYGCNLRCPFCHNAMLVTQKTELFDEEEIFSYLKKRSGILDGVCITGGEPMLQKDILKSISEELNYSTSYLSRRFKKNMEISFSEYVQKLRIEQSMCLLGNTDKKITEIATICGYSDMKFFNSIFVINILCSNCGKLVPFLIF